MERFVSYHNRRGQKLVGVFHQPDNYKTRAAVLVCHGFNDRKERDYLKNICVEASRRGLAALRFDFSGQGKSDGQFDQITYTRYLQDVSASLDFLSRQGITRVGIVGHSMGGLCAIAFALAHPARVAKLGLINTLTGGPAIRRHKAIPYCMRLTDPDFWRLCWWAFNSHGWAEAVWRSTKRLIGCATKCVMWTSGSRRRL